MEPKGWVFIDLLQLKIINIKTLGILLLYPVICLINRLVWIFFQSELVAFVVRGLKFHFAYLYFSKASLLFVLKFMLISIFDTFTVRRGPTIFCVLSLILVIINKTFKELDFQHPQIFNTLDPAC